MPLSSSRYGEARYSGGGHRGVVGVAAGVKERPLQLADDEVPGATLQDALRLRYQVLGHVGGRDCCGARAGHDDAAGG